MCVCVLGGWGGGGRRERSLGERERRVRERRDGKIYRWGRQIDRHMDWLIV